MAEAVAVQIDRTFDGARRRPRISHQPAPVDLATAEAAATEMLAALGLPIDSEDMFETPRRLVHAYAEMLTPPEFDSTTFDNAAGYDELVLVSDIPVHREQGHPQAHYFDPRDAAALAAVMKAAWENWPAGVHEESETTALEGLKRRTAEFGRRYVEIVRDVATPARKAA